MGRQAHCSQVELLPPSVARVTDFVGNLTHTKGKWAGLPFTLRDWQINEILVPIYGPQYPDGRRIVRVALVTIPRKNGKTELAAALGLYHLLGDGELGGEVYCAAVDRDQASIVFNMAAQMVRNDPELEAMLNIVDSQKRIVHYESGSFLRAISSEARSKHGFNASCIIYDELAQAPNRLLYDVLTTSTGAREQPLVIVISTVSPDTNSVFFELYDYGKKILAGEVEDPTFAPVIFEAPMQDAKGQALDCWDEKLWHRANPALGDFRSLEEMRIFAGQAQRMPGKEATFRNLYLNQMVDASSRFLPSEDWLAGKQMIDEEELKGRPCFGGLDLSSTTDLTAFILVFPPVEEGQKKVVLCFFWVPEEKLKEKADKDRVPYPVWAKQGYLLTTPGRAISKVFVARTIIDCSLKFDIQGIAFDRWRIADLIQQFEDEGQEVNKAKWVDGEIEVDKDEPGLVLVPWGQGYKDMGPAVDALEEDVLNDDLAHDSPVLDWNASNAVVTQDPAGARKLAKDKSFERVDGIVSLAMALALLRKMLGVESGGLDDYLDAIGIE